jgi:hypothetical protein
LRRSLVVILAVAAGAALWLEHGHRVVIDAPFAADATSQAAAAGCADNDTMPYNPSCIAFLNGATETGMRWRAIEAQPSIPAPQ